MQGAKAIGFVRYCSMLPVLKYHLSDHLSFSLAPHNTKNVIGLVKLAQSHKQDWTILIRNQGHEHKHKLHTKQLFDLISNVTGMQRGCKVPRTSGEKTELDFK